MCDISEEEFVELLRWLEAPAVPKTTARVQAPRTRGAPRFERERPIEVEATA